MSIRNQVLVGLALLIVGLVKAFDHSLAAGTLVIPMCFGGEMSISVDTPIWQRLHCWGCYVAAFGFALTTHALTWRVRQKARANILS